MREMRNLSEQHSQQPKQFRGGEKKVMKKRLAMLLSVAMAFSMFANVAFGAEAQLTTKEKFEALVKDGIFAGVKDKDGNIDPQLNQLTDRAQFAKILALTAGLSKEEGNSFKDKGYSTSWAKGYVEAVTKAGFMTGVGNEKFDLKGKVTGEQMAKAFTLALGLKKVEDAPAVEGVSKWAYGYVAAIKAAGFDFSVNGKWNVPVQRAVLVEAAYEVKQKTSVKVESVKALDEKTIEVKFTDGETVKHTLDKALVEGQETTVEVTHKGAKHQVKVTLEALKVEAKVAGLKKVEAKLNRTVDPAKVKVEIKRGSSVLTNKEVKFDDSKTTAQIELGSKMAEGEYTLTVTGASYQPISTTFKVEEEKVAKIELLGDKAAIARDFKSVSIGFKVSNQYGDDISKSANVKWNATKGNIEVQDNKLVLKSEGALGNFGNFQLNEKISISGVEQTKYAASVNATVTVSEFAVVDKIDFKGVHHADKKALNTDANYNEYFLLFDAFDQYGNKLTKAQLEDGVFAHSTNPGIISLEQKTVGGVTYGAAVYEKQGPNYDSLAFRFAAKDDKELRFDGKATINVIGMLSTKTFSYDVEVAKAATVTKFNLIKPDVVASKETVKIPFEAYDQFGNKITSYKALNDKISVQGLVKKQDPVTKDLVLEYTAPEVLNQEQYATVSANIINTAVFSHINFSVKKAAVPHVVTGVGASGLNVGVNGTVKLDKDNIKVQDQYGREMSLEKVIAAGYQLQLTNNNTAVVKASATTIDKKDGKIELTGLDKGYASLELVLVKGTEVFRNSAHTFNVNVVAKDAIASYEIAELPIIADTTKWSATDATYKAEYEVAVKVVGKKADGSTVAIDKDLYNVIPSIDGVTYDKATGKLTAKDVKFGDKSELKGKVFVNVDGASTTSLEKEITVSNSAPEAKSFVIKDAKAPVVEIKNNVFTVKAGADLKVSDLTNSIKVKNQYGVEIPVTASAVKAHITEVSKGIKATAVSGNADTITIQSATAEAIKAGEEFTVTFFTGVATQPIKVVFVN